MSISVKNQINFNNTEYKLVSPPAFKEVLGKNITNSNQKIGKKRFIHLVVKAINNGSNKTKFNVTKNQDEYRWIASITIENGKLKYKSGAYPASTIQIKRAGEQNFHDYNVPQNNSPNNVSLQPNSKFVDIKLTDLLKEVNIPFNINAKTASIVPNHVYEQIKNNVLKRITDQFRSRGIYDQAINQDVLKPNFFICTLERDVKETYATAAHDIWTDIPHKGKIDGDRFEMFWPKSQINKYLYFLNSHTNFRMKPSFLLFFTIFHVPSKNYKGSDRVLVPDYPASPSKPQGPLNRIIARKGYGKSIDPTKKNWINKKYKPINNKTGKEVPDAYIFSHGQNNSIKRYGLMPLFVVRIVNDLSDNFIEVLDLESEFYDIDDVLFTHWKSPTTETPFDRNNPDAKVLFEKIELTLQHLLKKPGELSDFKITDPLSSNSVPTTWGKHNYFFPTITLPGNLKDYIEIDLGLFTGDTQCSHVRVKLKPDKVQELQQKLTPQGNLPNQSSQSPSPVVYKVGDRVIYTAQSNGTNHKGQINKVNSSKYTIRLLTNGIDERHRIKEIERNKPNHMNRLKPDPNYQQNSSPSPSPTLNVPYVFNNKQFKINLNQSLRNKPMAMGMISSIADLKTYTYNLNKANIMENIKQLKMKPEQAIEYARYNIKQYLGFQGGGKKEYIKLQKGGKRLIRIGPKGGKYYMKGGKKVYIK